MALLNGNKEYRDEIESGFDRAATDEGRNAYHGTVTDSTAGPNATRLYHTPIYIIHQV